MKPKLKPIQSQIVVLAGATSGIGLETAMRMAEKGARVAILGRDEQGVNAAVDQVRTHVENVHINQTNGKNGFSIPITGNAAFAVEEHVSASESAPDDLGERIIGIQAEVTQFDQLKAAAEEVVQHFGRFDTWVNLAAVSEWALFEDTGPEEFQRIIEVNLLGQAYGAMVALPYLKQQPGGGALIFMSSIAGRIPLPYQSAYNASKHGILGMADTLRMEVKHTGAPISITTILPASINTPLFEKARTKIGVEPEPIPPVYDVHLAAQAILHAAEHPVRELIVGDSAYLATFMKRVAPTLTENYLGSAGFQQQRSTEQKLAAAPDNLHEHLPGYTQTSSRQTTPRRVSVLTWFSTHPTARTALFSALLAGAGALIGWRFVQMRRERQSLRYQLPRRARKITRQATKMTQLALNQAGEAIRAIPITARLPGASKITVFQTRRSFFQQLGDQAAKWGAALLALTPFIRRRRKMRIQMNPRIASNLKKRQQALEKQINRQSEKLSSQVNRSMNEIERQRAAATKAIAEHLPLTNGAKTSSEKNSLLEKLTPSKN